MAPREATRAAVPAQAEPARSPIDVPAVPVHPEGAARAASPTVRRADATPQLRDVFTGAVELSLPGTEGRWILVGRTPSNDLKLRHKQGETIELSPARVLTWNRDLVPENLEVTVPRTGRPPEGGWRITGPSTLAGCEGYFEVRNEQLGLSKQVPADMLLELNPAIVQSVPLERSPVAALARRSHEPALGAPARDIQRTSPNAMAGRSGVPRSERRVRFAGAETPEAQPSPPRAPSPEARRAWMPLGLRLPALGREHAQRDLQAQPAQRDLQAQPAQPDLPIGRAPAATLRRMNALRHADWARGETPEPRPGAARPALQRVPAEALRPVPRDLPPSPVRAPARAPRLDIENLRFERPRAQPPGAQPASTQPQVVGPLRQGLLDAAARRAVPRGDAPATLGPLSAPAPALPPNPNGLGAPGLVHPGVRPPLVARSPAPAPTPGPKEPAVTPTAPQTPTLALATKVQVPRSTGRIDPEFVVVVAWPENKSVLVMNDDGIRKRIPAADLIALNPQLIPRGAAVNVRNFGLDGSDWKIVGPHPQGALIQDASGRQEVVGLESLLASNSALFFPTPPESPAESPGASAPPSPRIDRPSPGAPRAAGVPARSAPNAPRLAPQREPGLPTSPERMRRAPGTSPETSPRGAQGGGAEPTRAPSDEVPLESINSLRHQPRFSRPGPLALDTLSPAARAQAARYKEENHIPADEHIQDGFYDGGRAALESGGFVESRREILLVDRQRDQGLMPHLMFAAGVKHMAGEPIDKARALVRHVWGALATFEGRASHRMEALSAHAGRAVLIGDVEKISASGVCRHRALFFKVLAEQAGLDVSIQRGNMYGPNGWHVWNVIDLHDGRGPRIVDVMNPSSDDFGRPYFPRVATTEVQRTYLDVNSRPLYGTPAREELRA